MFLCFFPLFFLNILFPASSQAPAQPELAFCTADNNQKGVLSLPEAKGTIGVCEGRGETSPPARHPRGGLCVCAVEPQLAAVPKAGDSSVSYE